MRFLLSVFAFPFIAASIASAQAADGLPAGGNEKILLEISEAQISLIQNTLVAAPIAGAVANVNVKEGDDVKLGDPMVRLRAEQAESELAAAKSAYEAARLESNNDVDERYAQRTLEVRERELQQSEKANQDYEGTVSETEIEKQKLVIDQSRLAIEQAEHKRKVAGSTAAEKQAAVQIAKARLEQHNIEATVSGKVTQVNVQPGEWVEAGKPVVRVISLNPLRAECFIDGRLYGSELVGHRVEFRTTSAQGSKGLSGHVDFVSPELNPVTGQVRLWATIANPREAIRPGMQGKLTILRERVKHQDASASRSVARPAKRRIAKRPAQ